MVKMHEPLRFANAHITRATVSRRADGWYVSLCCRIPDLSHLPPAQNHGTVGVDLGIDTMAVLSDGTRFYAPKPLKRLLYKLKRLQRKLSRAQKGSRNRSSLRVQVARLHRRIADIRLDAIHKVTSYISSNYSRVVIEDLNVRGMMKNHKLARAIADIGFYEFRRQLEYKMKMRGGELIIADRFFPSSKRCRFCGEDNHGLKLSDRSWTCPNKKCGKFIEDRDLNAAINLEHYPESDFGRGVKAKADQPLSESTPDEAPSAVGSPITEPTDRRPVKPPLQQELSVDIGGPVTSPELDTQLHRLRS